MKSYLAVHVTGDGSVSRRDLQTLAKDADEVAATASVEQKPAVGDYST